jgi:hypothetical protein
MLFAGERRSSGGCGHVRPCRMEASCPPPRPGRMGDGTAREGTRAAALPPPPHVWTSGSMAVLRL